MKLTWRNYHSLLVVQHFIFKGCFLTLQKYHCKNIFAEEECHVQRLIYQNSSEKISDIALKYGYESPTAFNRAFQTIHGVAPSVARSEGTKLKAYPPISFTLSIKGESELNYRIENKATFKVVGFSEHYQV